MRKRLFERHYAKQGSKGVDRIKRIARKLDNCKKANDYDSICSDAVGSYFNYYLQEGFSDLPAPIGDGCEIEQLGRWAEAAFDGYGGLLEKLAGNMELLECLHKWYLQIHREIYEVIGKYCN